MTYLAATLLVVVNLACLALNLFQLPGNWLMVATTSLVAWWRWDASKGAGEQMFSVYVLAAMVVLAVVGEVLEFVAAAAGARKYGSSRWGSAAALVGGLVGGVVGTFAIPIPVVGSLIGACGGACLGAWSAELGRGRKMDHSVRAGIGAGVGRLLGTVIKIALGAAIWLIVAVAAFWP
ncbi:MAG TPA: DUF456 domain-containing protein [Phycisphaerae bacterium]|nr:DUF456 domain-containing protein [Phycisphaerae bacterium]